MAEPAVLQVVVGDLADEPETQRLERKVLLRVPSAVTTR